MQYYRSLVNHANDTLTRTHHPRPARLNRAAQPALAAPPARQPLDTSATSRLLQHSGHNNVPRASTDSADAGGQYHRTQRVEDATTAAARPTVRPSGQGSAYSTGHARPASQIARLRGSRPHSRGEITSVSTRREQPARERGRAFDRRYWAHLELLSSLLLQPPRPQVRGERELHGHPILLFPSPH